MKIKGVKTVPCQIMTKKKNGTFSVFGVLSFNMLNSFIGQRYINITRNAIGPKSGQKDCRKF